MTVIVSGLGRQPTEAKQPPRAVYFTAALSVKLKLIHGALNGLENWLRAPQQLLAKLFPDLGNLDSQRPSV
jgi:hypothetical protein